MRRLANALVAGVGLMIALPVMVLMAIAIALETSGSPLFIQRRVGKDAAVFNCYKLRTMHSGTTEMATHLTGAGQVTKIGRILRKTKLDELPQLWNVLVGEMDIVGPRPCLVSQSALIEVRRAKGVFEVRPGITGLAQIQGIDMSDPEKLATVDALYIETMSLKQDIAICWATVTGSGYGDRTTG